MTVPQFRVPESSSEGVPPLPESELPEIQGLWIGSSLSEFEILSIRSFQRAGHPFRLFTYGNVKGIPDGVIVEDGSAVLNCALLEPFLRPRASLAKFADWFRWQLLASRGGYWVDLDMICLRPFTFRQEVIYGYQQGRLPQVAVLRFPAGHIIPTRMADLSANPHQALAGDPLGRRVRKTWYRLRRADRTRVRWGEGGGNDTFHQILQQEGLAGAGLPFTVFYPIHHVHWEAIFDQTLVQDLTPFQETRGLHLWNEMVRGYGDKEAVIRSAGPSLYDSLRDLILHGGSSKPSHP